MSSYLKAEATRIWQDEDTRIEYSTPLSFLWEMVIMVEGPAGCPIQWRDNAPKSFLRFADGSTFWVLGSYKRWHEKWERYLTKSEHRTLLFEN